MYGRYVCRYCGGYLDPGERCDCRKEKKKKEKNYADNIAKMVYVGKNGQLRMVV